jgi:hypothetical protein
MDGGQDQGSGQQGDPADEPGDDGKAPVERLRRTLAAMAAGVASRGDVEDAACSLVRHLRAEQHPPEQVLLRIKDILGEAGLRPGHADADGALYQEVIASCIEQYYKNR